MICDLRKADLRQWRCGTNDRVNLYFRRSNRGGSLTCIDMLVLFMILWRVGMCTVNGLRSAVIDGGFRLDLRSGFDPFHDHYDGFELWFDRCSRFDGWWRLLSVFREDDNRFDFLFDCGNRID